MNRLSIVGDWYMHADSLGKYVRYSDVKSIQAENDRLNAEATSDAELIKRLNASLADALAERDRLREALKWIANGKLHTGLWLSDIARKALKGEGK